MADARHVVLWGRRFSMPPKPDAETTLSVAAALRDVERGGMSALPIRPFSDGKITEAA